MSQKLIILDRDGVINHDSDDYIKHPDEWQPIEGSLSAIARLNHAGYIVAVASNQSGIARGYFNLETLAQMHLKMDDLLDREGGHIDAVFFCPHGPDDGCHCRKPRPGMLLEIGVRFNVSLEDVYFVGDTVGDIKAARAAQAQPLLVRTGKGSKAEKLLQAEHTLIPVFDNLEALVDTLLQGEIQ